MLLQLLLLTDASKTEPVLTFDVLMVLRQMGLMLMGDDGISLEAQRDLAWPVVALRVGALWRCVWDHAVELEAAEPVRCGHDCNWDWGRCWDCWWCRD